MPFYEVAYETGRVSVAFYEDDDEAQRALGEQQARAVAGLPGGPIGQPAERIAKVRVYKKHPNEYNPEQTMSADVASKEMAALAKALADENGVVSVDQLALAVRELSHPMNNERAEGFGSIFKMKEDRELEVTA